MTQKANSIRSNIFVNINLTFKKKYRIKNINEMLLFFNVYTATIILVIHI